MSLGIYIKFSSEHKSDRLWESWKCKELLWVFFLFILQIKVNETNRKESQGRTYAFAAI